MDTASVLLGLTPTMLSAVGPGIAEIALLILRRLLLGMLLAMDAPASFPSRFLVYDDPLKLLRRGERPSVLRITMISTWRSILISWPQYAFAILVITNLIVASLDLSDYFQDSGVFVVTLYWD